MNWRTTWIATMLLATPVAMAEQAPPPQFLEPYQACLVTESEAIPVKLEQAIEPLQHRFGLMERTSLPDNGGMLFVYQENRGPRAGFWMYNTLIPLDIAWLDEDGVIVAMDTMVPCETESATQCPSWIPGVGHRNVLEMNADFFEENHVNIGDRLITNLNDHTTCPTVD
ncbi:DUF192 domain-containing protein [Marinobacter sp. M1N3S26]|uniref:DUF192 domain-containing protein n=1 Tax=unclassified Marinobacter TaxID=83889 RepID=UPI00387B3454